MSLTLPFIFAVGLPLVGVEARKSPPQWPNRFFAVFAASLGICTLRILPATHPSTRLPLFLAARLASAMAAISTHSLLVLFESLTSKPTPPASSPVSYFEFLTACFPALGCKDLVATTPSFERNAVRPKYGPLHPAYATFLVGCIATSVVISVSQLKYPRAPLRSQYLSGPGLGLAICRAIADAHNATIRVDNNRRSRGTTVALVFPSIALSTPLATH